jgi:hypothetical protein
LIMKNILDLSLSDNSLTLHWFQKEPWDNNKLSNNSLFIDIDWKIYSSDMASTSYWRLVKNDLFIWRIEDMDLWIFASGCFDKNDKTLIELQNKIFNKVEWQRQLHEIMDYFSKYLNEKSK